MSYPIAVDVGAATTSAAVSRGGAPAVLDLGVGSGPAGSPPCTPQQAVEGVIGEATRQLGGPPGRLLLPVPNRWPERRRDLLRQEGIRAGVRDVRVLAAAVATATYHDAGNRLNSGAAVVVYDLGAGGFEATVLVRTDRGFECCADPVGADGIGGHAFDRAIAGIIAADLPGTDPAAVLAMAPAIKETLSTRDGVDVSAWLPGVPSTWLARHRFEEAIRDDVATTVRRLRDALQAAEIDPRTLAAVLLAGGSSRIPLVADLVQAGLGVLAVRVDRPKLGVCLGAILVDAQQATGSVPRPMNTGPDARPGPDRAPAAIATTTVSTGAVSGPLVPAGAHWARRPPAAPEPAVVVRLDHRTAVHRSRLFLGLLVLALAAIALVGAAVLLADLR